MKASSSSSRSITSPGRAENFPVTPPLVRFLRSNAGGRCRRRTRGSPLLMMKKTNSSAAAAADAAGTQEPSSPKVTCMGQIRVRRSKSGPTMRPGKPTLKNGCHGGRKALVRNFASLKLVPSSIRTVSNKLLFFFDYRSAKIPADSSKNGSNGVDHFGEISGGADDENHAFQVEERESGHGCSPSSATPPRNALMLTRCRSAPSRSSSIADRFWAPPLKTGDAQKTERQSSENTENKTTPTLEDELNRKDMTAESTTDLGFHKENECSNEEIVDQNYQNQASETEEFGFRAGKLLAKRCNSEPARGSVKFDQETSIFRRQRRLAIYLRVIGCTEMKFDI